MRADVEDSAEVRLAAPLLLVVRLCYSNFVDERRVPNWVQLPMKNGSICHLKLLNRIPELLTFMDRSRIYH